MSTDTERRGRGPYSPEFRRQAVERYRSSGKGLRTIAEEPGIAVESLRSWNKQFEVDVGEREGLSIAEREELFELRNKVKRLEQEREILKRVNAAGLADRLRESSLDQAAAAELTGGGARSRGVSALRVIARCRSWPWGDRSPVIVSSMRLARRI